MVSFKLDSKTFCIDEQSDKRMICQSMEAEEVRNSKDQKLQKLLANACDRKSGMMMDVSEILTAVDTNSKFLEFLSTAKLLISISENIQDIL